jgi:hypothetical protein
MDWIDFPLKMQIRRQRRPMAEIVLIIDTYSRFSGDLMYVYLVFDVLMTN